MKKIVLYIFLTFQFVLLSSCEQIYFEDIYDREPVVVTSLEKYDIWYLDYHNTQGLASLPFMNLAFTLSFQNGILYANNNISGIGYQGAGYGVQIGFYEQYNSVANLDHNLDGSHRFEIRTLSYNEIEMYHPETDTIYFLIGYSTRDFDYDSLFYDNIEYLIQDFEFWEKTATSFEGVYTLFEAENFLKFTAENSQTFYSSLATNSNLLDYWDFSGEYEVFDVTNNSTLKILELYYQGGVVEQFELRVLSDESIDLYHLQSGTSFTFQGREFIQYLKSAPEKKKTSPRRRIKRKVF
ncbi:MAG: hypothetical protein ACPH2K_00285 [Flavicella sp.]